MEYTHHIGGFSSHFTVGIAKSKDMNLSSNTALNTWILSSSIAGTSSTDFPSFSLSLTFPRNTLGASQSVCARKSRSEPDDSRASIAEDVSLHDEEEEEEFVDEDEDDEGFVDYVEDEDDDFDYEEDECEHEAETLAGDGGGGGGISLAGTWWDQKALEIAQQVSVSFDGQLDIYAFKTLPNSTIRVRIENLSKKSGSPNMEDIQAFTTTYRSRLDEAELAKTIPENIFLEVSSPGVERAVRIPKDLERFKDRAMYVKYVSQAVESMEKDGIFSLVSYDTETKCCTWGLANVRVNREKAGKGRPLNKKQREWRLDTPFESLRLVRLYSDI